MGCGASVKKKGDGDRQAPAEARTISAEDEEYDRQEMAKIHSIGSRRRDSFSSASANEDDIKTYIFPAFEKAAEANERIAAALIGHDKMKILGVDKLSKELLDQMVGAFQPRCVVQGEDVITQGDKGDRLYVIDEGNFDIFVARKTESGEPGEPIKVANFLPGFVFGELALLYDAPRAATVRCATVDARLWSLDREPFQMALKRSGLTKIEQYTGWLTAVDILKVLNLHEIGCLADACEEVLLEKDEVLMTQGEVGDAFYILQEGQCGAFIIDGGIEKIVKTYEKQGDYFGELALINNAPRKATVKATADAVVLKVEKDKFDNLMGPLLERLKAQAETYPQYADL